MRGGVFLDRDGTINEEVEYLSNPQNLRLIPGAAQAICLLNEVGIPVIVVTNQSGIGRGYFTETRLDEIHRTLIKRLASQNAHLDAIYYCPHHLEDGCDCRKPEPGMIMQAAEEHNIDLRRSWVIGDKISDLRAGWRVGCKTVLVLTGYGREAREHFQYCNFKPDEIEHDLLSAVKWIFTLWGGCDQ